jgi:hypothetical protein
MQSLQTVVAEQVGTHPERKRLGVRALSPGKSSELVDMDTGSACPGTFTVPVENVLVISSVRIVPAEPGPGTIRVTLWHTWSDERRDVLEYWVSPNDRPIELDFSRELRVPAGSFLVVENQTTSAGPVRVDMDGYLKASR